MPSVLPEQPTSQELSGSLLLIRHGQTDWNKTKKMQGQVDIPLNAAGIEQAHATGQKLADEGFSFEVLVSSPFSRAAETARVIGTYLGLELERTYPQLVERAYGDAEGVQLTFEQSRTVYQDFAGVEPEENLFNRTVTVLRQIVRDYPGRRVIVVSHGSVIRRALSAAQGFEWVEPVPNATPLEISISGLFAWATENESMLPRP
ncbi:histidine phosphatase family protein [Rothia sp. ZJ932]|uniref:histidine phosphatase family protein n=1 Tax=Rothia sp. ZJ932 TaxID=2810516 RepID=UPI0019675DD7|nr:histidine phosphatase family protein [Rothia sp. ZJ932]QRZ61891.1 histidine phosphatase family protein [Rothia sp. ZJ932]